MLFSFKQFCVGEKYLSKLNHTSYCGNVKSLWFKKILIFLLIILFISGCIDNSTTNLTKNEIKNANNVVKNDSLNDVKNQSVDKESQNKTSEQSKQEAIEVKQYASAQNQFSIDYPKNSSIKENGSDPTDGPFLVRFIYKSTSSITVRRGNLVRNVQNMSDLVKRSLKEIESVSNGKTTVKVESEGALKIGDNEAYQLTLEIGAPELGQGGEFVFKYVFVDTKDSKAYRLDFKSKKSDYEWFSKIIEKSINSFNAISQEQENTSTTVEVTAQNDAGSGKDAPNSKEDSIELLKEKTYKAELDPENNDSKDYYKILVAPNKKMNVKFTRDTNALAFYLHAVENKEPFADSVIKIQKELESATIVIETEADQEEALIDISSTTKGKYTIETTETTK